MPTQAPLFSTHLALTDPDSAEIVPSASPRFAGQLLLDSQGDNQQIYVSDPTSTSRHLSVLKLSQSVNDTAWATATNGTLYVTDGKANKVLAITGKWTVGSAMVAVTPSSGPGYLGTLNMSTGAVNPLAKSIHPGGMAFVP